MSEHLKKGWRWPPNSRKAHYFDNGELRAAICCAKAANPHAS